MHTKNISFKNYYTTERLNYKNPSGTSIRLPIQEWNTDMLGSSSKMNV